MLEDAAPPSEETYNLPADVEASYPSPAKDPVEPESGDGGSISDRMTSMVFGGKADSKASSPSHGVASGSETAGAETAPAATEGSDVEKEKSGHGLNIFERVAVAVGLMSSDDEAEAAPSSTPAPHIVN